MAKNGNLLLVDDEAYVRDSLSMVLSRKGFSVRAAPSVEKALKSDVLDGEIGRAGRARRGDY
jgi:DNA-binding NtrC family response regulator